MRPVEFIEPFAGGGSVSLAVAFESRADRVTMVELDQHVASVWTTILCDDGGADWLASRIATFDLTHASLDAIFSSSHPSCRELAFKTVLMNRVNRGGILTRRAGRLNAGERRADGTTRGLLSRWYPDTLSARIRDIAAIRDKITFIEGDGALVLSTKAEQEGTAFFIDPPYVVGGKQLYECFQVDHAELFRVVDKLAGDFLMTYDDVPEIHELAHEHNLDVQPVVVFTAHHRRKRELLLARDLHWYRGK